MEKKNRIHRVNGQQKEERKLMYVRMLFFSFFIALSIYQPVFASSGEQIIRAGFNPIYSIIAAIVSSLGNIYLLWGIFEWAQSLNTQDGGAQSMAFKRIASGLVATLGPQLVPIITAAAGTAST